MIDVEVRSEPGNPGGFYRARVVQDGRISARGRDPVEAFEACVTDAIGLGWEPDRSAYQMIEVPRR